MGGPAFSPQLVLHVVAPSWHLQGHGTIFDGEPAKDVGRPEPSLINHGERGTSLSRARPQATNNRWYVTKSFAKKLEQNKQLVTLVFSGQLASYYRRPLGVGDYCGLQNRVLFCTSSGSLAIHFLQEAVQAKIDKRALLDAIHPVFSNTQVGGGGVSRVYFWSTYLERQRPRLVTNLNIPSSFVSSPHFKMENRQTGLKRRLLYCPNLKTASKVPKFHLERNCMGFYSFPFWLASASQTFTKFMHLW